MLTDVGSPKGSSLPAGRSPAVHHEPVPVWRFPTVHHEHMGLFTSQHLVKRKTFIVLKGQIGFLKPTPWFSIFIMGVILVEPLRFTTKIRTTEGTVKAVWKVNQKTHR